MGFRVGCRCTNVIARIDSAVVNRSVFNPSANHAMQKMITPIWTPGWANRSAVQAETRSPMTVEHHLGQRDRQDR